MLYEMTHVVLAAVFGASIVAASLGSNECTSASLTDPDGDSSLGEDPPGHPPDPPPGYRYAGTIVIEGVLYWHYLNEAGEHLYVPVEDCEDLADDDPLRADLTRD